jgi:predicted metal-dependent hydrolase
MSGTALQDLPKHRITLGSESVEVRVRASPRAKMIRLRVGPEHPLEVIVPAGTSHERIDHVLVQRAAWIARKLDASRVVSTRAPSLGLERTGVAWIDGQPTPVQFTGAGRSQARLIDGVVRVDGVPKGAAAALARWYRREARRRLRATLDCEAARLGIDYGLVAVRDQRTRWGSCSRAANLAFNWRLLMAPNDVQRYVVVHELCHVRIRNHGKEFWRLLDQAMPAWREHAAWLREHGHELRCYMIEAACPAVGAGDDP